MVKGGLVIAVFDALIEARKPCAQRRRRVPFGLHLPQRDTDAGAAVTIACYRRRRLAAQHRIDHAPLDRKRFGIAADRKSTRLNSSHIQKSRMPSSA